MPPKEASREKSNHTRRTKRSTTHRMSSPQADPSQAGTNRDSRARNPPNSNSASRQNGTVCVLRSLKQHNTHICSHLIVPTHPTTTLLPLTPHKHPLNTTPLPKPTATKPASHNTRTRTRKTPDKTITTAPPVSLTPATPLTAPGHVTTQPSPRSSRIQPCSPHPTTPAPNQPNTPAGP